MRASIPVLLASVLVLRLGAAEQLHVVTPESLQAWSVSGADQAALISAPTLTLPAGAQISREFPSSAVILHLKTSPVFAESTADWPILNVGPAALALVRKDNAGRLVLVIDEATSEELPWSINLKDDSAAVDVFLAYDPVSGTGLVGLDDRKQAFAMSRSTQPVEIWLGAGARFPWTQERMEVLLLSADPGAAPGVSRRSKSDDRSAAGQLSSAMARLRNGTGLGESADGSGATSGGPPSSISTVSSLEVFTPPSVRRTRIVEAVRAGTERGQTR